MTKNCTPCSSLWSYKTRLTLIYIFYTLISVSIQYKSKGKDKIDFAAIKVFEKRSHRAKQTIDLSFFLFEKHSTYFVSFQSVLFFRWYFWLCQENNPRKYIFLHFYKTHKISIQNGGHRTLFSSAAEITQPFQVIKHWSTTSFFTYKSIYFDLI